MTLAGKLLEARDARQGDLIALEDPMVHRLRVTYCYDTGPKDPDVYLVLKNTLHERGFRNNLELWDLKHQKKHQIDPLMNVFLISRPEKETDSWVTKSFARVSRWWASLWHTP